jgi:predicted GIY-YIG superfamily endonuclease
MFSVYHIPNPLDKDNISDGYIGVASEVSKRFEQHTKSKFLVGDKIRSLKIPFESIKILETFDNSTDAYFYEGKLRPQWKMGWNITPGGEGYQKDNKQDVYTRAKMSNNRKGKGKPHTKERYIQQSLEQKGRPRKKVSCPFCGKTGGEGNMHRWHFAKCKEAPTITQKINGFDCDGVIFVGFDKTGLYPGPRDVIITGRSFEELKETYDMLTSRNINNLVYFNKLPYEKKTRISSGQHKGETIWNLFCKGTQINLFYEDDWDQYKEIKKIIKKYALPTQLIWVNHGGLINLENTRHVKDENNG